MLKKALAVAAVAVLCGGALAIWSWRQWTGPGPGGIPVEELVPRVVRIRIAEGMSLRAAADTLAARGLLERPLILVAGARLTDQDRQLRAGLYELRPGLSPRDLLAALTRGPTVSVTVTIPEGLTAEEIATLVADSLGFAPEDFLAAADLAARREIIARKFLPDAEAAARYDSLLVQETLALGRPFHWCEGYLGPDTYNFAVGTEPKTVAGHVLVTQLDRLARVLEGPRSPALAGLSGHEILTLASIVEAEARRNDERPLIAAVFANRLRQKWRLEADPTAAYPLGKKGKRILLRDLEVESAFNTYRAAGLPPGPIGNPGAASLAAAARPDTTFRAMFFVSDGIDGHIFTQSVAEHEAAVERFRQLRAAARLQMQESDAIPPQR